MLNVMVSDNLWKGGRLPDLGGIKLFQQQQGNKAQARSAFIALVSFFGEQVRRSVVARFNLFLCFCRHFFCTIECSVQFRLFSFSDSWECPGGRHRLVRALRVRHLLQDAHKPGIPRTEFNKKKPKATSRVHPLLSLYGI